MNHYLFCILFLITGYFISSCSTSKNVVKVNSAPAIELAALPPVSNTDKCNDNFIYAEPINSLIPLEKPALPEAAAEHQPKKKKSELRKTFTEPGGFKLPKAVKFTLTLPELFRSFAPVQPAPIISQDNPGRPHNLVILGLLLFVFALIFYFFFPIMSLALFFLAFLTGIIGIIKTKQNDNRGKRWSWVIMVVAVLGFVGLLVMAILNEREVF